MSATAERPRSESTGVPSVSLGRIPSLDGLRAISITLVLLAHVRGTRGFPKLLSGRLPLDLGVLGVRVFFVISGFLITSLLLGERAKTGTVSLPRFYLRRTLRIFPPYYVYILVVVVLQAVGWVALQSGDLLHAVTYTVNYHRDRAWWLGHAWSLSVEEQFYLLWPAVFLLAGTGRALRVIVGFLMLAPLWRLALGFFVPSVSLGIGETFFTTADAIGAGCLLALARPRLHASRPYRWMLGSPLMALVPVGVLFANASHVLSTKLYWLAGMTVESLLVMVLVDWATLRADSAVGRFLNTRPLVLFGMWSYSTYLWQQMFLNRHGDSFVSAFPLNLVLAVAAAATSYYVVEQPSLRFREWLERRLYPRSRTAPSAAA